MRSGEEVANRILQCQKLFINLPKQVRHEKTNAMISQHVGSRFCLSNRKAMTGKLPFLWLCFTVHSFQRFFDDHHTPSRVERMGIWGNGFKWKAKVCRRNEQVELLTITN